MKHTLRIFTVLVAFLLASGLAVRANVALNLDVENLHAGSVGSLSPAGSTVVLLVSTANSSFGDLAFSNNPALADTQFTAEADDRVLGMFEVLPDGVLQDTITFSIDSAVTTGDPLLLVWYPDLPYNPSRQGPGQGQRFGTYRSDAATEWSNIGWLVPDDGFGGDLAAISVNAGGDVPDSILVATQISQATPLVAWQNQYFNCYTCPQAQPNADPYGKGISNTNQFLMGLNPTNSASTFKIITLARSTSDMTVTWKTAGGDASGNFGHGKTNVLEYTTGTSNGGYTNNFVSTGITNIINTLGDVVTFATDVGGATNKPARYYRVRFLAP